MKKNLLFVAIISIFLFSCDNLKKETENTSKSEITAVDPIAVSIGEFSSKAEELAGKDVILEGIVDHVCEHGGDKMFIISEDTNGRIRINVGENMASFNTEWEGNKVKVKGIVEELIIDEDYLNNWENELLANAENEKSEKGKGLGNHDNEEGDHKTEKGKKADQGEHVDGFEQIENLRDKIAETEKGYLAFYSILCSEYKFMEETKTE